jgi:hypothetical protein
VKVVEGSEIYSFPIHHLVHFYFKIGRKPQANRGTMTSSGARARRRAGSPAQPRAQRLAPVTSASGPRPRLPEARAPSPGCPAPLERLGVRPPCATSRPLAAPDRPGELPVGPPDTPHVTYQKLDCFPMCEFSQKFKTFCVNM